MRCHRRKILKNYKSNLIKQKAKSENNKKKKGRKSYSTFTKNERSKTNCDLIDQKRRKVRIRFNKAKKKTKKSNFGNKKKGKNGEEVFVEEEYMKIIKK